jgi:hypothetical protein
MSTYSNFICLFLLLLLGSSLHSQTHLTGYVYSEIDSTALTGASVYFDGTSTGVSTTDKGYFRISLEDGTTSPLVVSSLGYETIFIPRNSQLASQPVRIYLKESEESLGRSSWKPIPGAGKRNWIFLERNSWEDLRRPINAESKMRTSWSLHIYHLKKFWLHLQKNP